MILCGKPFIILALYVCVCVWYCAVNLSLFWHSTTVCVCVCVCVWYCVVNLSLFGHSTSVCVWYCVANLSLFGHKLHQRYILLCTLYLHTCQVRVTADDSGLCCCTRVTYFERLLECWLEWCERCELIKIYVFKLRLTLRLKTAKCRQHSVKPSLFLFIKVQSCHEMNGKTGDQFLSQTVITNCWRNVLHYD